MAISEYIKTCAKNVPGNRLTVYLKEISYANSLTVSNGEITALTISNGATGKFVRVQADIDSANFTIEGAGQSNYSETQTLEMMFGKKTANLVDLKDDLIDAVACGVMAIRVDNNGQAWLSGWNEATKGGKERPFNRIEANFTSGAAPTDEDGGKYTIRLIRQAGYDELPFATALNASIVKGSATAGAFIKFS